MRQHFQSGIMAIACVMAIAGTAAEVKLVHHPRQSETSREGTPRIVVADADAHGGTAQAAVPEKSQPGSPICSFYSYARPAGRYRITWRVKVADNTLPDPVFNASTGGGGRGYKGGAITLKATDFAEPNVYQDFSYTAEKGEGGFFGVRATWLGKTAVWVDSIVVLGEELYTDRQLVERSGGVELPDQWLLPQPNPPRIHIAKGLWWNFFGLSEMAAELGGAITTSSYHTKGQYGTSLRGFPSTWQQLADHNLIILANVDARALGPRGRLLLSEYVKNGGSLLVFGGPFSFEKGGFEFTALEDILPCRLVGTDRTKADHGLVLKPATDSNDVLPADLSWQMLPHIYFYHSLEPRPEARVLVSAGDYPVLTVWQVGRGRVATWAGTAEGTPPDNELAFWQWGDFPRLMAAVCQWLVAAPPPEARRGLDDESRHLLEQLALAAPGEDDALRQRQLTALLAKCADAENARELLDAADAFEVSPSRLFTDALAHTVRPFVTEDFQAEAKSLIDSGDAGKAALGLQVLGMCRSPGAGPQILRFLNDGLGAFGKRQGHDDGLGIDGMLAMEPSADIAGNERLQLAAVLALGDLGDPAHLDAISAITRTFATQRQGLTEVTELAQLKEDTYQQSLAARCRLGDARAAGPLLKCIVHNESEIQQFQNALDQMLVNEDDKRLMHLRKVGRIRLPSLYRRQQLCAAMLERMPYSVADAFVQELVRQDDPGLTAFAFAALTPSPQRKVDAETALNILSLLQNCTIPELQLFAFRIASTSDDVNVTRRRTELLTEMAVDPAPEKAIFALRRAAQMPPAARQSVILKALDHPDPEVSRLARLSRILLPPTD